MRWILTILFFYHQISFAQQPAEPILLTVEIQPEFPGGQAAMYKFLAKNITYPAEAQKANISGRVFKKFIVKKDGIIENVLVLKGT